MTNRDGSYGYQKMKPPQIVLMLAVLAIAVFAILRSHGVVQHAPLPWQTTHQTTHQSTP